jgi:hypothetical protein
MDVEDRYLGVRLIDNTDTLYGWIRLNAKLGEGTIKDFAIQLEPSVTIQAGEISCDMLAGELPSGPFELCSNMCKTLIAPSPFSVSYQWLKNGQPITGAINTSYEACEGGAYSVVLMQPSGCIDTSNTAEVIELPNSDPPIVTRIADTLYSSPALTYQWYRNNLLLPSATDQSYVPAANDLNYKVKVVYSNGCELSTDSIVFGSCKLTNLALNPEDDAEICSGSDIELTIQSVTNFGFQWMKDNFIIPGAITFAYFASEDGIFHCLMSGYDMVCNSDSIIVKTFEQPVITQHQDTLISSYANTNQWRINGIPIAGAVLQTYIPVLPGNYTVRVNAPAGCQVSEPVNVTFTSTVDSIILPQVIQVSITGKSVTVTFSNSDYLDGDLTIFNALGQVVRKLKVDGSFMTIPFANESGWFIIEVKNKGQRVMAAVAVF